MGRGRSGAPQGASQHLCRRAVAPAAWCAAGCDALRNAVQRRCAAYSKGTPARNVLRPGEGRAAGSARARKCVAIAISVRLVPRFRAPARLWRHGGRAGHTRAGGGAARVQPYDVFPRAVRRQRARQLDARLFASCMYFSIRMAYASRIRVNQRACRPRASSSAVTQHGGVHIPATHAHPPVSRSGSLGLVGANRRVHQLRRADALLADRVQVVQEFAHARHLLR